MTTWQPTLAFAPAVRRHLWVGIGLSVALHAALLALRFAAPAPAPLPPQLSLEVVLLNLTTPDTPEQIQALAQTRSAGGGPNDAGLARSPLPAWSGASQLPAPAAAVSPEAVAPPTAAPRELLTRSTHPDTAATAPETAARPPDATAETSPPDTAATAATPDTEAMIARLTQQYAAISQRLEEASQRPRQHYFAPSTSPWAFAEYVEQWRDTVETWGNRHYPPQLRGRLYGSLQLTVRIRADGTLAGIELDTPSVYPEINDAARLIVQRAAPFAPFPDALRREADMLSITRTWHFENDALRTQAP